MVRCEPELATKVKERAKAHGRKTEPYIRELLMEDVTKPAPVAPPVPLHPLEARIELMLKAMRLQEMFRGIEIPLTLPGDAVSVR
ncbi:MAG: hypothetical protein WC813_03175 [Patescibacteria group bacterium]